MPHLKELRSFVAVVADGSLSAAARRLQLPKSTLSRHLKKLENDAGLPLLKRESRRLVPTESGITFHHYGTRILELADEGLAELERMNEAVQGELTLYVNNGLIRGWLGSVIQRFMDRHPKLRIVVHTYLGQDPENWRDAIFLWMGELPEHPLRQECLTLLDQGIYGERSYLERQGRPQHPEDLHKHHWIDLLENINGSLKMRSIQGQQVSIPLPDSRLRADQLVFQGDAIADGRGLGLMPNWQAELRMRAHPGCFERCLPEWDATPVPVWLTYPHGKLPPKHRTFISHLRDNLPPGWNS